MIDEEKLSSVDEVSMGAINHDKATETLKALPKERKYSQFYFQTESDCWLANTHQFSEMPVLCRNFMFQKVLLDYSEENANLP